MQQQITNDILFNTAKKWLKTPFRWHGRTKYGCDCVGFIIGVLSELKIIDNSFLNEFDKIYYGNNLSKIDNDFLMTNIERYFIKLDKKDKNQLEKTDLILLQTKNSPIHFAFYSQKYKQIIHSTRENGVVIIDFNIEKDKNVYCCFKIKDV